MATFTLPKQLSDLLLVEVAPGWTKQRGTLRAGADCPLGTVLSWTEGNYQPLLPGATDGTETAAAVLAERVDATAADQPCVVIARGAVLAIDELVWPAGIAETDKTQALAALNALGIVTHAPL